MRDNKRTPTDVCGEARAFKTGTAYLCTLSLYVHGKTDNLEQLA